MTVETVEIETTATIVADATIEMTAGTAETETTETTETTGTTEDVAIRF